MEGEILAAQEVSKDRFLLILTRSEVQLTSRIEELMMQARGLQDALDLAHQMYYQMLIAESRGLRVRFFIIGEDSIMITTDEKPSAGFQFKGGQDGRVSALEGVAEGD